MCCGHSNVMRGPQVVALLRVPRTSCIDCQRVNFWRQRFSNHFCRFNVTRAPGLCSLWLKMKNFVYWSGKNSSEGSISMTANEIPMMLYREKSNFWQQNINTRRCFIYQKTTFWRQHFNISITENEVLMWVFFRGVGVSESEALKAVFQYPRKEY